MLIIPLMTLQNNFPNYIQGNTIMSVCQSISIVFKVDNKLKLSQSPPCIWSAYKMYTVFLLVAVGASLFLGTVQQCCGPSKLQTYFDVLTFLPGGRGSTVTYVSICVFSVSFS